jgi:hypothetical protein
MADACTHFDTVNAVTPSSAEFCLQTGERWVDGAAPPRGCAGFREVAGA